MTRTTEFRRLTDDLSVAGNFIVEIDGQPLPCARVSGLELASRVEELESKKDPEHPEDPKRVLWSAPVANGTLLLTRALDGDRTLYAWRKEAMSGEPAVRTVVVRHLERAGGDVLHTWQFTSAWPLRWAGPRYDALHGGVALEELELVFQELNWQGA
jgi:phage tail-like protein